MNLAELQREAHSIAKDHGWWDEERSFGDLIALVHSELSEALEAYREHGLEDWRSHTYSDGFVDEHPQGEKPEGVPSELADVVIRVADMAEHYGVDLERVVIEARTDPNRAHDLYVRTYEIGASPSFGDWITQLHSRSTDIWNGGLQHAWGQIWHNPIGLFVHDIERMAAHYGIDLDTAIAIKMEYNKTRPYRHGGKAL